VDATGFSSDESSAVLLQPPVAPRMWCGHDRAPVPFDVVAPEWTVDAAGWVVALFADVCRAAGVETSVQVSVAPG